MLFSVADSPPRFALATAERVVRLHDPLAGPSVPQVLGRYPLGSIVQSAKITRIDSEHGLYVDMSDGTRGFVHVSRTITFSN